jgi:hypothetical protein
VVALGVVAAVYINSGSSIRPPRAVSAGSSGSQSSQASQLQAARAYASCMRSHGDSGFPDPNSQGNFGAITQGSPTDPNSPAYKAAQPSCQSLMPQQSQQQQQQNQSQGVRFAACMRSHGVSKFPDPNAQGGFLIQGGVDNNSPTFKAAMQACQSILPGAAQGGSGGS